jgi:hypothetical protein
MAHLFIPAPTLDIDISHFLNPLAPPHPPILPPPLVLLPKRRTRPLSPCTLPPPPAATGSTAGDRAYLHRWWPRRPLPPPPSRPPTRSASNPRRPPPPPSDAGRQLPPPRLHAVPLCPSVVAPPLLDAAPATATTHKTTCRVVPVPTQRHGSTVRHGTACRCAPHCCASPCADQAARLATYKHNARIVRNTASRRGFRFGFPQDRA